MSVINSRRDKECVTDEAELDDLLSEPSSALIDLMKRLSGDLIILGIGGKMGISMGQMAVRAVRESGVDRRVIGVSRFSDAKAREHLERVGVEIISCDFLDPAAVAVLPQAQNVVYMAGRKFGTQENQALTWAVNTVAPAHVASHFSGSRMVVFSTGCVYPLVCSDSGGCDESVSPAPIGEYAQSALARERVFTYYSQQNKTPVCLYRLNYAIDLRYGVLHDIARCIWQGQSVDTAVTCFNVIWQGDANEMALRALEHCLVPAGALNVTGPETVSVRYAAERMAGIMNKPVSFTGRDSDMAYLNNSGRAMRLFGYPRVSLHLMMEWTARWIMSGGVSLDKPTHFEVNTGQF